MAKKKNNKNNKNNKKERQDSYRRNGGGGRFTLPEKVKKSISAIAVFILAIIVSLSFFEKSGVAGTIIRASFTFLIGKAVFFFPVLLVLTGLILLSDRYKKVFGGIFFANLFLLIGVAGFLEISKPGEKEGGCLGYIASPLINFFGLLVTEIIFGGLILAGVLIFWHFLAPIRSLEEYEDEEEEEEGPVFVPPSAGLRRSEEGLIGRLANKIKGKPSFDVKEIDSVNKEGSPSVPLGTRKDFPEMKIKKVFQEFMSSDYQAPPLELLDQDKGVPSAGDTARNSAIIKRTLENFSIPVEMSGINIGPTVTQYTLKPAEGIKLSKITTLSNDLSLALASHPIRIEAPVPGKSLVGIEIPNKIRTEVRLRYLIQDPKFKETGSSLSFCFGKDVSGNPFYGDIASMPHMLVAGATGTGKTIFLNSLIISLLYRNSPEDMRLILIDPKRVEFSIYQGLPHLLCSTITEAPKAVSALKWLITEMERRFEVLAKEHNRDIKSYNILRTKNKQEKMPYIVVIIDELADLMLSMGREVESSIVRLAQMARAVGIHLVLATQRPSVEVITGLIKANVTSRLTFQVASQVDSRTVLDMSGAERLLGKGDMLFLSAQLPKPKRIQGAFISEEEVKRVVDFIKERAQKESEELDEDILESSLEDNLEEAISRNKVNVGEVSFKDDDPLYEEAKRIVIESKKASASLLQRRLSVGYARAARLRDMLEEKGIVGHGEGAKPRQVFFSQENSSAEEEPSVDFVEENENEESGFPEEEKPSSAKVVEGEEDDSWKKI